MKMRALTVHRKSVGLDFSVLGFTVFAELDSIHGVSVCKLVTLMVPSLRVSVQGFGGLGLRGLGFRGLGFRGLGFRGLGV